MRINAKVSGIAQGMAMFMALFLCSCSYFTGISNSQTQTMNNQASSGEFTDLGIAVKSIFTVNGLFTTNEKNERVFYGTTRSGEYNRLYRYNTNTKTVDLVVPMEKAKGAWAIAMDKDNIYVGTYLPSSVYKYNITRNTLTEIATFNKEGYVWTFKIYGRDLYIGTYPTANLYRYNMDSGIMTDLGQMSNEKYIRSIEAYKSRIYLGIGAKAQLIEYDPATKKSVDILPKEYAGDSFAYNLVTVGDKMFIGLSPSNKIVKYDFSTKKFELMNILPCRPPTFSADTVLYYGYPNATYEYNEKANTLTRVITDEGLLGAAILDKKVYAGVNANGFFRELTMDGKLISSVSLPQNGLPASPAMPFSITAYDNTVYVGERQLRIYNVYTKADYTACIGGEPKAMCYVDGSLYTADYTSATFWGFPENVLQSPASFDFGGKQFHLFDIGHEQNRPLDIDYNKSSSLIAIGSEPEYGQYGGALTIYDLRTKAVSVYKDIVPKHSINSVCFDSLNSNVVYAGTSTYGGTGTNAIKDDSAHLVKFDTKKKSAVYDIIPEKGNPMIVRIASAWDKLYLTTDTGSLYEIDAASGKIINQRTTGDKIQSVLYSKDGKLYATGITYNADPKQQAKPLSFREGSDTLKESSKNSLFIVNPKTLDLTVVKDDFKNIRFLIQDIKTGVIYLVDQYTLWSYTPSGI